MVLSPLRCSTSATHTELVTTVRLGIFARCSVRACVVVPAETAIAMPACTNSAARAAMASFSPQPLHRLGGEARLGRRGLGDGERAAVHLLQQALAVERDEVAPHRHVGDAEQVDQVGHAHGAAAAQLGQDHAASLRREHQDPASRTTATPPAGTTRSPSTVRPLTRSVPVTGTGASASPWLMTKSQDAVVAHAAGDLDVGTGARQPLDARLGDEPLDEPVGALGREPGGDVPGGAAARPRAG